MRVASASASSWPLSLSRRYVATCETRYYQRRTIYTDRSYLPACDNICYHGRDAAVLVVAVAAALAAAVLSRFGEALGDYQVLRARHKGLEYRAAL